jgi:hypothetical protein
MSNENIEREVFEINGEHLIKIFSDQKFIRNLGKMNAIKKYESGFAVNQDPLNKSYDVSLLDKGSTYEIESPNAPMGTYNLIEFHSHPDNGAMPSIYYEENGFDRAGGDLSSLLFWRQTEIVENGFEILPIMGILPLRKNGKKEMLLIQERKPFALDNDHLVERLEGVFEGVPEEDNLYEVIERLNSSEFYRAGAVFLSKNGYDACSLETISGFGFVPEIINKEKFENFV